MYAQFRILGWISWEESQMTDFTKPDGYSSWNTIYPVYINSKRTRNEGRRIPVDLCCEDPTINELESVTIYQMLYTVLQSHIW